MPTLNLIRRTTNPHIRIATSLFDSQTVTSKPRRTARRYPCLFRKNGKPYSTHRDEEKSSGLLRSAHSDKCLVRRSHCISIEFALGHLHELSPDDYDLEEKYTTNGVSGRGTGVFESIASCWALGYTTVELKYWVIFGKGTF